MNAIETDIANFGALALNIAASLTAANNTAWSGVISQATSLGNTAAAALGANTILLASAGATMAQTVAPAISAIATLQSKTANAEAKASAFSTIFGDAVVDVETLLGLLKPKAVATTLT